MNFYKLTTYVQIFCILGLIWSIEAKAVISDSATGLSFPETQTVNDKNGTQTLEVTGVATRKKFFFKIYSVAHYMEAPPNGKGNAVFGEILSSDRPKQLDLKWVRSVSGKKIQDGYKESFEKNADSSLRSKAHGDISRYISFFRHGANEGDTHQLNWLSDGTVEVVINGRQVGSIKNRDFAEALWSIWFGRKSVVNRNDLVSRIR